MTVTTPDAPPAAIGYATEHALPPADRPLRRLVGWAAVAYGALTVVGLAAYVLLAYGPASGPPGVSYRPRGSDLVQIAAGSLAAAAVAAGGALVLLRSPAGVGVLRAATAATALLTVGGTASAAATNPAYAAMWAAPATVAIRAHHLIAYLWPPALLAAVSWLLPRRAA